MLTWVIQNFPENLHAILASVGLSMLQVSNSVNRKELVQMSCETWLGRSSSITQCSALDEWKDMAETYPVSSRGEEIYATFGQS
jgi:hypothetical protein